MGIDVRPRVGPREMALERFLPTGRRPAWRGFPRHECIHRFETVRDAGNLREPPAEDAHRKRAGRNGRSPTGHRRRIVHGIG